MDDTALADLFEPDYYSDRATFECSVRAFAMRTGRHLEVLKHPVDEGQDLYVTAAQLRVERPRNLLVLVIGTHGIEGYTGSAVVRLLLSDLLLRLDAYTGLLLVHGLNPYGFAHFMRVNRHNVDLNRNCARSDGELLSIDDSAYSALASVLSPKSSASPGPAAQVTFAARMLTARARAGDAVVRRATLAGQYRDPLGLFWGGNVVQHEVRFFQQLYARNVEQCAQVLLVDLHTGYGQSGQAYALFGRADTPAIAACAAQGVSDGSGREASYEVFGDLVGYCHHTAKRLQPSGIFDGLALELGTHGLSMSQQLQDLYTVVQENQARHFGAEDAKATERIRAAFRELFCPSDRRWRARALRNSVRAIEGMLRARRLI